jgi:ribosome maturation protein SDO1
MKEKNVLARFSSHGKNFEIIVDAEKARLFKEEKLDNISEVLVSNAVFRNIRTPKSTEKVMMMESFETAERISDKELQEVFGTTDFLKIAEHIIKEGEIQLTTDQRKELIEQKKRRIIDFIVSEGVDPKTGSPHPPLRIENAINQVKVRIDPFLGAEMQAKEIIRQISSILPISVEKKKIQLKIPIQFSGKARNTVGNLGTVLKETWGSTEWIAIIEISAGSQKKLFDQLNSITHGQVISEELK